MKLVVGFDGMHRAGKGTQISLLCQRFRKLNISYIIARGDGTRRGTGSSEFDYPSIWWNGRWDYFHKKTDKATALYNLNIKFQRLNREARVYFLRCLDQVMNEESSVHGIMLLDRTLPSRYSTMRSFYHHISFEDSIKSYNPKNNEPVQPIKPELTFILHAPKEILLKRLSDSTTNEEDLSCKTKAINNYYAEFEETINLLKDKKGYYILDSTNSPEYLNNLIWLEVSKRLAITI
jgi:thymidylate kinase